MTYREEAIAVRVRIRITFGKFQSCAKELLVVSAQDHAAV
jgi:hypothetical protein